MRRAWALPPLLLAGCGHGPEAPPVQTVAATPAPKVWTLDDLRLPAPVVPTAGPAETPQAAPTEAGAREAVAAANREGLELPTPTCFTGKTCTYWYHPDKQFRVFMAQDNQTLACLKPGERVLNVVAPGEQVWLPHLVVGYGPEERRTECVAFMPRRAGLKHQVSIFTDQRKYDLDVQTWTRTRHVEVRWRYPEDVLAVLNGRARPEASHRSRLRHCAWRIDGDAPPWRPAATADGQPPVCDDGEVTVIQLPSDTVGGRGLPGVWRLEAGERLPVQAERVGDTLQVAGVHPHLLLALGDDVVHLRRSAGP